MLLRETTMKQHLEISPAFFFWSEPMKLATELLVLTIVWMCSNCLVYDDPNWPNQRFQIWRLPRSAWCRKAPHEAHLIDPQNEPVLYVIFQRNMEQANRLIPVWPCMAYVFKYFQITWRTWRVNNRRYGNYTKPSSNPILMGVHVKFSGCEFTHRRHSYV